MSDDYKDLGSEFQQIEQDDQDDRQPDELLIYTNEGERGTRFFGKGPQPLKVEKLAENINIFLGQMETILDKTPEKLGKFKFTDLELYAEINAKGQLSVLGTGGEAGVKGGLKFVFRRSIEADMPKTSSIDD